jgi:hypothetical protein
MAISDSVQKNLAQIKKNIEMSYSYNKDNVKRYHDFRKYVYKSSVTDMQKQALASLQKPLVEFNIQPAYISRLLGEFAKHEPSIEVTPSEGIPVNQQVIDVVEGHLRHIIYEANKNSFSYKTYQDCLTGGFSVFKVYTDYVNPMSFKQIIKWERCFDPTMCGFDPLSRNSHKGDGNYCFEIYPLTEEDFQKKYPDKKTEKIKYSRNFDKSGQLGGFNWSYKDATNTKIVLCAEYYEKKKKKIRIVELANGVVMPLSKYEKEKEKWREISQIPIIVGEPRWTEVEIICRYRLIESEILEYEETDYSYLPLIHMVGSGIELTEGNSNCVYEMTIPYVYHSRGAQELKNFAGQSLANYLENMIQSKYVIKKEAFPQEQDYIDDLINPQNAAVLVVNAFHENNPELQIPDPFREVQNPPAPPEIMSAFQVSDVVTQTILGSFASNIGKNDNDLSGKAVIESASVGNAAAMPYVMGYLAAIKQASLITVDLMPKYILGERDVPVVDKKGRKGYNKVNTDKAPHLDYEQGALKVDIEPGVSFQVQKSQALQQLTALMQASQEFSAFMNSPQGLRILVKNLTIYSGQELEEAIPEWIQQQEQEKQQAMQSQQQMMMQDPRMISAKASETRAQADVMKVQMQGSQQQFDNQVKVAELAIEKEKVDNEALIAQHQASLEEQHMALERTREETSLTNHALDAAAKIAGHEHKVKMDEHESVRKSIELHHKIGKESKEKEVDEH